MSREKEPFAADSSPEEILPDHAAAPSAEGALDDADMSLALKLQKAQAQKIEAELNLRKFALERDIEQLQHSHLARNQQLTMLGQQTSLKQYELQSLKSEIKELTETVSQKRLAVETLKTAMEAERQQLTGLKNAVSDTQMDIQKLQDSRSAQEQFLLDHDRQIKKFQERQAAMLLENKVMEGDLEALQELLTAEQKTLEDQIQKQRQAQDAYDELLKTRADLEKDIHRQEGQLAMIVESCQDQAQSIVAKAHRDAESLRDEAQKAADLLMQESLQKTQNAAAEKLSQAEAAADRAMAEGRMEATRLLASSRDKSRALVEEAENHSSKLTSRAQTQYEQLLEDGRREASVLISQAQNDGERLTEEAKSRANLLQSSAYEEKTRILEAAEEAQRKILEDAQVQRESKIAQANTYAKGIVDDATQARDILQKEIDNLSSFRDLEKNKFYQALEAERQDTLKQLHLERQAFSERAQEEEKRLDSLRTQLVNDFTREKNLLYQDVEREKALAAAKAAALMKTAEEEHSRLEANLSERRLAFDKDLILKKEQHEKDLQDRAQKLTEEWNKKGEKIARSLEQKAQELAEQNQAMKLKADEEIKTLRALTERDLVQQRMQQETALQNWIKAQQENFQTLQTRQRGQILDTITALVQGAVRPYIPGLDPQRMAQIASTIRKAADEAFLEAGKQTQAASLHAPQSGVARAQFKDLRYWRQLFLHSSLKWGALAAAVVLAIVFWNFNSDSTSMSAQNSYVQDEIKKRKRIAYAPEQSLSYKASYTDNVLYTNDYLEYERHKDIRNRWIVSLNRYGLDRLDVSNEAIVKLLAKEATMLKQLERIRGEIDGKEPGPEIARMRELEDKYRQQLTAILGSDEKFKAFLNFKANYFEKVLQQTLN